MNDKQLETIVGLFGGLQNALIAVVDKLGNQQPEKRAEMAAHLRASADHVPSDIKQRELFVMVLKQLALGLESVQGTNPEIAAEIKRLLH